MPTMPPAILVVEDERDIRELLVYVLTREGYRVLHAPNGQAALEKLERSDVDLVLTDVTMPVMDGAQMAKLIRSRSRKRVPVVLLSALPEATIREVYDRHEVFLQKPFQVAVLLALIRRLLPLDQVGVGVAEETGNAATEGPSGNRRARGGKSDQ